MPTFVPNRLIVHHSASLRSTTIEQIRAWHTDPARPGGALSDIGYHAVIDGDATLRYGRDVWVQGAHDAGQNYDSLGICVTGDNTLEDERWTLMQTLALIDYMISCRKLYGPMFAFELHREHEPNTPTACPGISDAQWREILEVVEKT